MHFFYLLVASTLATTPYKGSVDPLHPPQNANSETLKNQAISYYKEQEQEKAFETYLAALAEIPIIPGKSEPSGDEKNLYEQALRIYLDPRERDPKLVAQKIKDMYEGTVKLHPQYKALGYIVAVADANLGNFQDFFSLFFHSYKDLPDHFLAYKTKAILHIKLYEKGKTPEEKEAEKYRILYELQKAKERHPTDPTLYRLQITFAPDGMKNKLTEQNVNDLIKGNIMVPRSDLAFYFDQMFAEGNLNLAKAFLAKARQWYPYSRILSAAEEMIHTKEETHGKNGTPRLR